MVFEGASTDYTGVDKLEGAAKRYYKFYKKMFDEFAARNEGNNAEGGSAEGVRYAMGGVNAATADRMKLATAEKMLESGTDAETVRKETGWYKGYDGKWRFEIDDSAMRLAGESKLQMHEDDGEVYYTAKLNDVLEHAELLATYPELEDYTLIIQKTEPGTQGTSFPKDKQIVLAKELFEKPTPEYAKRLNSNEEIKRIEQTPEYKEYDDFYETDNDDAVAWLAEERKVREKFFSSEIGKRYYELRWGKFNGQKWMPGWSDSAKSVLIHELQHSIQYIEGFAEGSNEYYWENRIKKGYKTDKTPGELYYSTAGEIEARDVASRVDMTAEQRKNTRPDIDRTDVVFADGGASWMAAKDAKYDPETSSIAEQIRHYQDELNKMDVVGSAKVPTKFSSKADAANWAIKELNPTGYQVDRQNFGKIYFSENDIKYGVNYADTDAEKAALVLLPKVLKRGIVIEEHSNHKGRSVNNPKGLSKRTITIAAPVELNGIRGNMGAVINGNGNHYYTHRILLPNGKSFTFSEAKAEARQESYRVGNNINPRSDTTSLASDKSISQSEQNVNTEAKNSSEVRFALPMDDEAIEAMLDEAQADGAVFDREAIINRGAPIVPGTPREKMYTRAHAYNVFKKMSDNRLLSSKSRKEFYDTLYRAMNSFETQSQKQGFAHEAAEYYVAKLLEEGQAINPEYDTARDVEMSLHFGIGKIAFTPEDMAELRARLDDAEIKSILGRWGKKKSGTPSYMLDMFTNEVSTTIPGMSYVGKMHPVNVQYICK